jgi:hypothetical protein
MLFGNPAVKILEERLWEDARKRYVGEHPSEARDSTRSVMRKVKTEYKDTVAATLKESEQKIRAKWAQFSHVMKEELNKAFTTVLRMSNVEWYSVEFGQLPYPTVIAAPYQLLKHLTADVVFQFLRKEIDFEDLDDETLEVLATYAADQRFEEVLQDAQHTYATFEIGSHFTPYTVADVIKKDPYFLGEEKHHSLIDMVIFASAAAGSSDGDKNVQKAAVKKWLDQERKNRRNDRRFAGDGWEIEFETLKFWTTER